MQKAGIHLLLAIRQSWLFVPLLISQQDGNTPKRRESGGEAAGGSEQRAAILLYGALKRNASQWPQYQLCTRLALTRAGTCTMAVVVNVTDEEGGLNWYQVNVGVVSPPIAIAIPGYPVARAIISAKRRGVQQKSSPVNGCLPATGLEPAISPLGG
eukprot:292557-Rhodomonas_salina.1